MCGGGVAGGGGRGGRVPQSTSATDIRTADLLQDSACSRLICGLGLSRGRTLDVLSAHGSAPCVVVDKNACSRRILTLILLE